MAWFSGGPDRRVSPRFQAEVPLVVSVVGEREIASLRAQADGISEGGLSLSGVAGVRVGQAVSLQIHLPTATQPIWVEAVVRQDAGHYGLQFQSLSDTQKKLIKRYCSLQPRQKRRA
jgi:c-di-GMP-binding flagellar brake protein YcgR